MTRESHRSVPARRWIARLGEVARSGLPGELSPEADAQAYQALDHARRQRERARRRRAVGTAVMAMAAAIGIAYVALRPAPPLPYTVHGGTISSSGYVQASFDRKVQVRFGDGSTLALAPKARGRVVRAEAATTHVVLEEGKAQLRVTPRRTGVFRVDAGPFEVEVTGTRFDVQWSSESQHFDLVLHEGSVRVSHRTSRDVPVPTENVWTLRGGQRLTVDGRNFAGYVRAEAESDARREEIGDPSLGEGGASDAGSGAEKGPPREEHASADRRGGPSAWPARVASGDFEGVFREARAAGIDRVLEEGSAAEISALGDAASYTRRSEVAARARRALRRRFPDSLYAKEAAFLLGRHAEDARRSAEALRWYATYTKESPEGPYAHEALGRTLVLLRGKDDRPSARSVAARYLARHPNGPYAPLAHHLQRDE